MKNEIDLSKAYVGQIATLANGESDFIDSIFTVRGNYHIIFRKLSDRPFGHDYAKDGKTLNDNGTDIVSLLDTIQVQCARIEGEIKGLEYALNITAHINDGVIINHAINDLKEQLLTLQNQ